MTSVGKKETYAIKVSGIESILEYADVTILQGADDYVLGLINCCNK